MKRFFYFWRFPIYFGVLFFVLLFAGEANLDNGFGIFCSVTWLFIDIPCLIIFTIRALYKHIRSFIEFLQTGEKEEDYDFVEFDFIASVFEKIGDEISSVLSLSVSMRIRYLLFRIGGIVLIIVGCIACFCFYGSTLMLIIFTLVIIGGATLCIVANPKSYNESVSGVRMVPCPSEMTEKDLYDILCTIDTPLGSPRFANVRGFDEPIMVYGSSLDSSIYAVYRPTISEFYYVSSLSSFSLLDELDPQESEDGDTYSSESGDFLPEITSAVEEAMSRFKEE